jgi:hypothetical protein
MRLSLDDELAAIAQQCRPGAPRLREYARLVGQLEQRRAKTSLNEVRHGLNQAIRRVYGQAQKERGRR